MKGYTRFINGDILLAKITPCMENGKFAIAEGLKGGCGAGSTEFHVLRPFKGISNRYLLYYILQAEFRRAARMEMQGAAGQLRVPTGFLETLELPLAPEPEQVRIVTALDAVMSSLELTCTTLEANQDRLATYRAAVLRAACEGRLVPTEAELARAGGHSVQAMSSGSEFQRDSNFPIVPQGWTPTNLGRLKNFSLYGPRYSSAAYGQQGYVVLRTSDISNNGRVNLNGAPRVPLPKADFIKYRVEKGDLVFTRTGATIGKVAVFDDDVEAIPGAYLIHYRLAAPKVTSWFVFYQCLTPRVNAILRGSGAGVGRPNLNEPTISAIPLLLPPEAEQHRIVAEVERRLSVVERLEASIEANLARAKRLRQAILKRAFEGRLVPQDPRDEPASVLLERIRKERTQAAPKEARSRKGRVKEKGGTGRQATL
jgi:type I restriction enzyme S subunit